MLGITKHGDVQGFERPNFHDMLMDMLHERCDPVPNVEVENVRVRNLPVTLVHVYPRAPGIVYSLDKDKIYVRAGATDRLARKEHLAMLFYPVDNSALSWRF